MTKNTHSIRNILFGMCLVATVNPIRAACDGCAVFGGGEVWGDVTVQGLTEASGLAASRRHPGVLWVHNDGSRESIFAIGTNGVRLATLALNRDVVDVEDIAVGPGPVAGINYVHVGDIGGSANPGDVRPAVTVLRFPEPLIDPDWASDPRSLSADGLETFTLTYPDGAFDAEALLVDPLSGDVLVVTKQPGSARWYRANLASAPGGSTVPLGFVAAIAFGAASGGDFTADGGQFALRRENFAMVWDRCDAESLEASLSRPGSSIPVVGPPGEPNGEAIAWLTDGTGYLTLSEGSGETLFWFQARCPVPPQIVEPPEDQSVFVGGTAVFQVFATGYPPPEFEWRFENDVLPDQSESTLELTGVAAHQAGAYSVIARNEHGSESATVSLTVRPKPELRITEVMSSPAASASPRADWWELTSFESQAVNLAGWRFNDGLGGLADPFVLPAGSSIAPGETVVFVETLSPAQFQSWWGAPNLPANVRIVSYSGGGLSFSASGDQLTLWDAQTGDAGDFVTRATFGSATTGVTFAWNPATGTFGKLSVPGIDGAFVAAGGTDIGSPGHVLVPLVAPTLTGGWLDDRMRIGFEAAVGRVYELESLLELESGAWEFTGDSLEAIQTGPLHFEVEPALPGRYFRVRAR